MNKRKFEMKTWKPFLLLFLCAFFVVFVRAQDVFKTIQSGDLEALKTLLDKNPELIHAKDKEGDSTLTWAVVSRNIEIARFLIENGAEINESNQQGYTPLHWAAIRASSEMAKLLIQNGANMNICDYENQTPLHKAGITGNVDVAKVLVEEGADIDIKDAYGRTPLLVTARERGNIDVIRILLERGADINARDNFQDTPLTLAAWRGFKNVVDLFIEKSADIPSGEIGRQLVVNATAKGLDNLFNHLLGKGIDLEIKDEFSGSLLHSASRGGSEEIVKTLIEKKFAIDEPDFFGWTPLHYAAERGHNEVVKRLLDSAADINKRNLKGESAFNIAIKKGEKETAKILVDRGASQNPAEFPRLKGEYFGQKKPGEEPELFARGIVSDKEFSHSTIIFSPDGREAFWPSSEEIPGTGYTRGIILHSKQKNGYWQRPKKASFSGDKGDGEPFFSIDGKRLYFISRRPFSGEGEPIDENIWYVERKDGGWSDPLPFSETINSQEVHWQFSLDAENSLYFGSSAGDGMGLSDIYCSRYVSGEYTKPENLGCNINSEHGEFSPFIASDGSYLIFSRYEAGGQRIGLFISFRKKAGSWTRPVDMGKPINDSGRSLCTSLSPDGKYIFYLGNREGISGMYWMKIDRLIEKLKKEALEGYIYAQSDKPQISTRNIYIGSAEKH
jgi:ankyrin repeat protein